MPVLHYGERRIEVPLGTLLRKALLDAGESPHNGAARGLNCRGLGFPPTVESAACGSRVRSRSRATCG